LPDVERRKVVAIGGGGFAVESESVLMLGFLLSLARSEVPRVCFIPTASGDNVDYVARFYRAFSVFDCRTSDLQLFDRSIGDLEAFVLEQDVIYVGGGNTANLLAVWRVHGLDKMLIKAWGQGTVLSGISAGMNCWFDQSVTDSYGKDLAPLADGLGLLPGSACPHYDGEELRRPTYRRLIESDESDAGWAADDGAALVFSGTSLAEVVSSRPDAAGYRVERSATGVSEQRLATRYLGNVS
jgi:peptidase E